MRESKARVICNPTSGGGAYDLDEIRERLNGLEIDWIETGGPEDAVDAAQDWREGLLLVAGGDGTINDVVNGLGRAGFPEGVTLGILPSGTGNDLAATLEIPDDAEQSEEVIRQRRVRTLDVARVRSEEIGERFFINVATGGLGAEISSANDEKLKKRWGKLSYLRASLEVARNFEVRELTLYVDGREHQVEAVNIAVGNCRYTGGGWPATPKANPEADLLGLTPAVLAESNYLDSDGVFFVRAKEIRIETSPPSLEFTADGEVIGNEPAQFSVLPSALKVIVGPDYVPEPAG